MPKKVILILGLLFFWGLNFVLAQGEPHIPITELDQKLPKLTEQDLGYMTHFKRLEPSPGYNPSPLPSQWDNSTKIYFRPIFHQIAYECGQAAGIGYNFTYEMNRLRNVSGSLTDNQYPPHFAWCFQNGGLNNGGVSCMESWDMLKSCGTPTVTDFGGMTTGYQTWTNGYSHYYNAMLNKVDDYFFIPVGTADGLTQLKQYLYDHLEGSPDGGVANFYANLQASTTLPAGTPHAGQCVVAQWANYINHCMTIVGWDDSIRYDYNGDGQYTNNIDINGDGVIDMRDWEIGGLKFANSYGTGYYNNGFSYMMYKTLADKKAEGGIWNSCVFVVRPKASYSPKLTFKVTLKHTSRDKLKITAGVSTDTTASSPDYIEDYHIFNYQGGAHYLLGGDSIEANKTMEFGLDVTPLLNNIPSGQKARFFLIVNEKDPYNEGTGQINSFSLLDYGSTLQQVNCPQSNVPLIENGTTMLAINKVVSFPQVNITNSSFPVATIYKPYQCQMSATGGTSPYHWTALVNYSENMYSSSFPAITTQVLTPTNNSDGTVSKDLGFEFPFYGKKYSRVVLHVDGYLMFDDQQFPWVFVNDELSMFEDTKNISPFMTKTQSIDAGSGDGMWYDGNQNYAIFRWKTSVFDQIGSSTMNYAVKLYPNGNIEFYYGTINYPWYITWTGGFSCGDQQNYHLEYISNMFGTPSDLFVHFQPAPYPLGMQMSPQGLFYGTPTEEYDSCQVLVGVKDNSGFSTTRLIPFTTKGFKIDYSVNSGGNSIIEFNETALLSFYVKNIGNAQVNNAVMHIRCNDPFITLTDSIENLGNVPPGDSLSLNYAFSFSVSANIPDNHPIAVYAYILSGIDTMGKDIPLVGYAPVVALGQVAVNDMGNHMLDPGETTNINCDVNNLGGATATNLSISLSTTDPYLTLNTNSSFIPVIGAHNTVTFPFNVTASSVAPMNHLALVNVQVSSSNQATLFSHIYLMIGHSLEDFESGNFTNWPWITNGNTPWYLDDSLPYEGLYAARSGDITDNQYSHLYVNMNVLTGSPISFYKRVSCEQDVTNHNYDYLAFYIDGAEQARWDGEQGWGFVSFPVGEGFHTLRWTYRKDYSVSVGKDAGWVDKIIFPTAGAVAVFVPQVISNEASVNTFPNPFRDGCTILVELTERSAVTLVIYDLHGEMVRTLVAGTELDQGPHDFTWDGTGESGKSIRPGIYFYRLISGKLQANGKLIKIQ